MGISRSVLALAIAVVTSGLRPAAVAAAPAPFEGLRASCSGIGDTILTSPGEGPFTPAFIEGTDDLLVPYTVDLTVTGPSGPTILTAAKAAPLPADPVTCAFDVTLHLGGTTYTIVGSVTGIVVGEP